MILYPTGLELTERDSSAAVDRNQTANSTQRRRVTGFLTDYISISLFLCVSVAAIVCRGKIRAESITTECSVS